MKFAPIKYNINQWLSMFPNSFAPILQRGRSKPNVLCKVVKIAYLLWKLHHKSAIWTKMDCPCFPLFLPPSYREAMYQNVV